MHHKLQNFPRKNDVQNSVVRNENSTPQAEIPSNDAGLGLAESQQLHQEPIFREDSGTTESTEIDAAGSAPASSIPGQEPSRSESPVNADVAGVRVTRRPDPLRQKRKQLRPAAVPQILQQPHCEVARSDGYDPTGENAVACGALAQVLCEYCGPICSSCAEETFCFSGEHRLSSLEEPTPAGRRSRQSRRVSEVVYVEIKCPNCRRVRLALPKKHRPKARRKCPVCKREGPAEYLAHGITRKRLPYHEVFTTEKELPEGVEFKRRMPWDSRPPWWVEED